MRTGFRMRTPVGVVCGLLVLISSQARPVAGQTDGFVALHPEGARAVCGRAFGSHCERWPDRPLRPPSLRKTRTVR